ncbi:MAG: hypothetical protein KAI07_05140, partial [Deltaproteobacteria bacterium]|nr:hypothetical protein [Deltaproteobacteria bacterium]
MPKFSNVQTEAGVSFVGLAGQSATWGDYNLDGWPDIFLSNSDRNTRHKSRSIDRHQVQKSFLFLNEEGRF